MECRYQLVGGLAAVALLLNVAQTLAAEPELSVPGLLAVRCDVKVKITADVKKDCQQVLDLLPEKWSKTLQKVMTFEGWKNPEKGVQDGGLDLKSVTVHQALSYVAELHAGRVDVGPSSIVVVGLDSLYKSRKVWFPVTDALATLLEPGYHSSKPLNAGDIMNILSRTKVIGEVRVIDFNDKGDFLCLEGNEPQLHRLEALLILELYKEGQDDLERRTNKP